MNRAARTRPLRTALAAARAIVVATVATGCSSLTETEATFQQGPYLQVGGLYARESFDEPAGVEFDDSIGFGLRGGYRAGPALAGELIFEFYNESEATAGSVEVGDVDGYSLTANGKFLLSTSRLQPYGMLGLGVLSGEAQLDGAPGLDLDENDLMARVAVGVDHHDAESFWIGVELSYNRPLDDLEDFPFYALSIGFGLGL